LSENKEKNYKFKKAFQMPPLWGKFCEILTQFGKNSKMRKISEYKSENTGGSYNDNMMFLVE
jgi:hypothetical protein